MNTSSFSQRPLKKNLFGVVLWKSSNQSKKISAFPAEDLPPQLFFEEEKLCLSWNGFKSQRKETAELLWSKTKNLCLSIVKTLHLCLWVPFSSSYLKLCLSFSTLCTFLRLSLSICFFFIPISLEHVLFFSLFHTDTLAISLSLYKS